MDPPSPSESSGQDSPFFIGANTSHPSRTPRAPSRAEGDAWVRDWLADWGESWLSQQRVLGKPLLVRLVHPVPNLDIPWVVVLLCFPRRSGGLVG